MKKYVFIDLDGTLVDYNTNTVPQSAIKALQLARKNGHELILTTGRPPALFYGIDQNLGFDSYIAANGRIVVYKGKIIHHKPIPSSAIEQLLEICRNEKIDIAYESQNEFVLESSYNELYKKFCDYFHLKYPKEKPKYYKTTPIYQICMFYTKSDFKRFEKLIPSLSFEYSNPFGLDVNTRGGLKDTGIRVFEKHLNLNRKQIITIGDGYNDISMIRYAEIGVAMGNAFLEVKEAANIITDVVEKDGLFKAFKQLELI
jgi:Cof subfamily protein (haloacid dehalogenase superfamily)